MRQFFSLFLCALLMFSTITLAQAKRGDTQPDEGGGPIPQDISGSAEGVDQTPDDQEPTREGETSVDGDGGIVLFMRGLSDSRFASLQSALTRLHTVLTTQQVVTSATFLAAVTIAFKLRNVVNPIAAFLTILAGAQTLDAAELTDFGAETLCENPEERLQSTDVEEFCTDSSL